MMTITPAQAPDPYTESWFQIPAPPRPLGADAVPWYDTPQTWPLWGRLVFGGVLLVGVFGIVRFATKEA